MKTRGVQVRSQITKVLFASSFLLFINAATCFAQDKTDFKVGDSIYVNIHSGGCVKATVKGIDPKYYVHVEKECIKEAILFTTRADWASANKRLRQKIRTTTNLIPVKR
jgi:hypothetical protein